MRGWEVGVMAAVLLAGCGRGTRSSGFAVADSADAEVVSTPRQVWDGSNGWSVDPEPDIRIGLSDGDPAYLFENVVGVALLAGRGFVVADGMANDVRYFDAHGTHVRTVGGTGQGPGELESEDWLGVCGDGVWVFDRRQSRVTSWTLSGDFRLTFPLHDPGGVAMPYESACGPTGRIVTVGWGERKGRRTALRLYQQEAPVELVDPETGEVIHVGQYISSERVGTSGGGSGPHPFGRGVVFALNQERLFIGNAERLQVQVRDHDGKLLSIWRGPDEDLEITSDDIARYRGLEFSRPDSLIRQGLEKSQMPMPSGKPAYTKFLVDDGGNLWVKRFAIDDSAPEGWGVFAADGRFLGHLTMPDQFHLMDVADSLVAGVSVGELGVERVEVHHLARN